MSQNSRTDAASGDGLARYGVQRIRNRKGSVGKGNRGSCFVPNPLSCTASAVAMGESNACKLEAGFGKWQAGVAGRKQDQPRRLFLTEALCQTHLGFAASEEIEKGLVVPPSPLVALAAGCRHAPAKDRILALGRAKAAPALWHRGCSDAVSRGRYQQKIIPRELLLTSVQTVAISCLRLRVGIDDST